MSHHLQQDLVVDHHGELSVRKRTKVAAHLRTCAACTQDSTQLGRVEEALAGLERISPSPDFAATFWKRLEQDGRLAPEILDERASRWWHIGEFECLTNWQIGSTVAAAASLLIVVAYFFSVSFISQRSPHLIPTKVQQEPPNFFMHYQLLKKMEQLQHLESVLETSGSGGASQHS